MLNRRMPNGMYGGVRGERKSPLLDSGKQFAETVTFKVTDTSVEIQDRREIICRMGHHLICRTTHKYSLKSRTASLSFPLLLLHIYRRKTERFGRPLSYLCSAVPGFLKRYQESLLFSKRTDLQIPVSYS